MQRTILVLLALLIHGIASAAERPFDAGLAALHKDDLDGAISQFAEDIRLHPENGAAYDNRGFAYLQKGDVDTAIADFNTAIRIRSDIAHPYSNRAHAYEQKGDLSKAIADYSQAIQLDPNRADDYNNRGAIYGKQRQWDKAIVDFDAAIQKNPGLALAYLNREMAYLGKGGRDFKGFVFTPADAHTDEATPPPLLARPPEIPPVAILSDEQARKAAISMQKPDYPIEARRRHLTGKGVYQLTVSEYTGEVLSVDVLISAGYQILDRAAVKALKLWKFRPHAVIRAKVPITFSMPEQPVNKKKI